MTVCPNGHRFEPAPVVYGLPTAEAMDRANRGEITLGGCVPGELVEMDCPECGAQVEWASRWASRDPIGLDGEPTERPI